MGPTFDVMMMNLQDALNTPGQSTGGSIPAVPPPPNVLTPSNATPPAWSNPNVGGRNLLFDTEHLGSVATQIKGMGTELQATLAEWRSQVGQAHTSVSPESGSWPQADQLSVAVEQTHQGISDFVNQLSNAHVNTGSLITTAASTYHGAEIVNAGNAKQVSAFRAAQGAPSSTVVTANGIDLTGTPQQRGWEMKLAEANGGSSGNDVPVVTAQFSPGSTPPTTTAQLSSLMTSVNGDAVTSAGRAYGPLVSKLHDITVKLNSYGSSLADTWAGSGAVNAVGTLQQLQQTAGGLVEQTYTAGQGLTWYGQVLSTFQKANKTDPPKPSPPGLPPAPLSAQAATIAVNNQKAKNQSAADQQAQKFLSALNGHIGTAYNYLPMALSSTIPPALTAAPPHHTPPGGSGGGIPGPGGLPGGGVPGGGVPGGGVPGGGVPGGGTPGPVKVPTPAPITVAGGPPPTAPPVTAPVVPPAGPTSGGGSPFGNGPLPALPVTSALGSPEPGLGPDGLPVSSGAVGSDPLAGDSPGGLSDPALAGEPIGGEAGGFPGMGMGGMGMGGMGAGGPGGTGRARQSWASEEDGTWMPGEEQALTGAVPGFASDGMIAADTMPGAVGSVGGAAGVEGGGFPMTGAPGLGGSQDQDNRQRQSWMYEDPDIWAEHADGRVPPMIG